jgi:hypothetical protein
MWEFRQSGFGEEFRAESFFILWILFSLRGEIVTLVDFAPGFFCCAHHETF